MPQSLTSPASVGILIAAISSAVLGSALASQYWGGLEPCQLCLLQRIPYGVTIALGLLAALPLPRGLRLSLILLASLAFATGAALAGFHVGVEQKWWDGLPGCSAPDFSQMSLDEMRDAIMGRERVVPCDEVAWSLFGISMAGYNFMVSIVLAGLTLWLAGRISRR